MTKLVIRCNDHGSYRGLEKPSRDCKTCKVIHELRGMTVRLGSSTVRVGSA